MSTYIAPAALGLGDLVVALPVVQSLIAQGEEVVLVMRLSEHLPLAARIPGLSGVILEWELEDYHVRTTDQYYDLRDHYLQRRYWWGSREFEQAHPGLKINDVLSIICHDLGLTVDFDRLDKLTYHRRADAAGKIAFVPGSAIAGKYWPGRSWLALAESLIADGASPCVVGQPEHSQAVAELLDRGLPWCRTETLGDALDVVSSCSGVVSVDTGLMHLAVHQGTPTVGIFRRAPVYIRNLPGFLPLIAGVSCDEACYQNEARCAHNHRSHAGPDFVPLDWTCQAKEAIGCGSRCLDTITAAKVVDALHSLIGVGAAV